MGHLTPLRNGLRCSGVALTFVSALTLASLCSAQDSPNTNIPFEKYTLPNGLEVILHQDLRVSTVAVSVWYHVGSGDETVGRSGFAHLFEHMMFQGSKHVGEDKHFSTLRNIGASSINGTTNKDRTNYFEVVPSNQLETALWLESDRMGYMLDLLSQKSLDNQRDVVRNERRQRYDNVPYGKERFAIASALYPEGHPYRYLTIGRHEDLEAAGLDDVKAFFKKWYVPSNATLAIGGNFDIPAAKAAVEKWFAAAPKRPAPARTAPPTPALAETTREVIEDPFAKLPRVRYVWHSPPYLKPGDSELDVLATALGAKGWGRLYKKLVMDDRIAQSVAIAQYSSGFSSEFHISVTTHDASLLQAIEAAVKQELERVTQTPLSEAEVTRAVRALESRTIWGLESLLARVERLQSFNHFANDPGFLAQYLETQRTRTPAMVLKTAQDVLSKPRVEIITMPSSSREVSP